MYYKTHEWLFSGLKSFIVFANKKAFLKLCGSKQKLLVFCGLNLMAKIPDLS